MSSSRLIATRYTVTRAAIIVAELIADVLATVPGGYRVVPALSGEVDIGVAASLVAEGF